MSGALNIDLLRKVWNMAEHGTPGERIAARARVESMMAQHGRTIGDIPTILSADQAARPDDSLFRYEAHEAEVDRRYREMVRQQRVRMTPAERAASEAFERWVDSGAMNAQIRWQCCTPAQRNMLLSMQDPATIAVQRTSGTILDLFDQSGQLLAKKIGLEGSVGRLVIRKLVAQERMLVFRITKAGGEVLRFRNSKAPRGPYDR